MTKDQISKSTEIEYNALKAEQRQRISTRDNILYLQIVSVIGLMSVNGKLANHAVLILVPFASLVFGWKYYINDLKVTQIGEYFRGTSKTKGIFEFELFVRSDDHRKVRKYFELTLKFMVFVVPLASCCFFSWYLEDVGSGIQYISILYSFLGMILFYFLVLSVDS